MTVVGQRKQWRESYENGEKPSSRILEDYRENRENPYWRLSGQVEALCEYILFLEEALEGEIT